MATTILNHAVRELIHESANSLVYRSVEQPSQTPRVLKVLKANYPTPEERTRYQQEYEIIRSLELDGVVRVYRFEKYQNSLVMCMEDFGGESLSRLLPKHEFSVAEALRITSAVALTLAQIHQQQIIHKDINPSNIIYNPDSQTIKIIDFGISTRLSRENPTIKNPGVLEGTLAYMSPEQTGRMNRSVDYRTDFYSLGVTFYQLLTGRLPFETVDALELVHAHIARRAPSPHELDPRIPVVVSDIAMKLMAKTAEERYQSGWGLAADLNTCLERLTPSGDIEPFELGTRDISGRFQIPEKLYGRAADLELLLDSFERASQGAAELVLVAGYSGIGKSALVHEVHKPITRERGFFIAGKFDQLQRNTPYSAVVHAFADLMRQLLTEGERELVAWRHALQRALGINAQIIIDVIPEVELIIGPQPPVKQLGAAESQNRFNLTLQNFVRVFCKPEHPLVVFLDDLQWADAATLKLLELIMTSGLECFLLIGAYRNNEVSRHDPLMLTIDRLREQGTPISTLELAELSLDHITQLTAETLHCDHATAAPLAALVVDKTRGNPFFVTQFLLTLYQEGLLSLRPPHGDDPGGWVWNMADIRAMDITDNVVELMVERLRKLPSGTQNSLRLAACMGNQFDLHTLALIHEASEQQTYADLLPAVHLGLLIPTSALETQDAERVDTALLIHSYRFLHDRVQQAAYALIDESQKQSVHLRIGRLLLDNLTPNEQTERVFEIIDHVNLGRELISAPDERLRLVQLNLEAGKKAKFATAYDAAARYLEIATQALSEDSWETHYQLTLDVYNNQTELTYLIGNAEGVDALVDLVIAKARSPVDKAQVYKIQLVQCTIHGRFARAIEIGREALSLLGIELPRENIQAAIAAELTRAKDNVGDRAVASLIDNPEATDTRIKESQKLLGYVTPAAFLTDQQLFALLNLVSVNLSLTHGNVAESALGFANYGITLGSVLGDYQRGHEFGLLGLEICAKYNGVSEKAPICLIYGVELAPWVTHAKLCEPFLDEGYKAGLESGEVQWSGYLVMYKVYNRAFQGKSVRTILDDIDNLLPFAVKIGNRTAIDGMRAYRLAYRNLAGESKDELSFHDDEVDGAQFVADCQANQGFMATCLFNILQAQSLYLYGQYEAVVAACRAAEPLLPFIIAHLQLAEQNLFYSLALVALYPGATPDEQQQYLTQLDINQKQLKTWADNCPENYLHKYLLVAAEIAALNGDDLQAMALYDQSIASAQEHDYIQYDALAKELAAEFWFSRGKQRFANSYLSDAYYAYGLWGAKRKVAMLERSYPYLAAAQPDGVVRPASRVTTQATTTGRHAAALDLATVMKASQAISSEIVLEALLAKLMTIAIENAGAEQGYLILDQGGRWVIEATGTVHGGDVTVLQSIPVVASGELSGTALPLSLLNYVARAQESVILADAANDPRHHDNYFKIERPKSVLCTPLVKQGNLMGLLYLENNLATGAFTESHLEVLKLLSSQAAISLENAKLYDNLSKSLEMQVQLTRAASRFVPNEFLAFLGKENIAEVQLGDHIDREMTVMFSDVRSFTTMSEAMTSGENFAFVNAYLRRVVPVITGHSGFIVKYLGDGVMAMFPNSANDAVDAAVHKLRKVDEYNGQRRVDGFEPIRIGIGLHTGRMRVGMVGDEHRMQGDALSDHVNLTARLEGLTKHYGVSLLISEQTFQRLRTPEQYGARFLGRVQVKGRREPVAIYEIFDGDAAQSLELKRQTRAEFDRGIECFHRREFDRALEHLNRVLATHPDDRPARLYHEEATSCQRDGVPEGWDAVKRMTSK